MTYHAVILLCNISSSPEYHRYEYSNYPTPFDCPWLLKFQNTSPEAHFNKEWGRVIETTGEFTNVSGPKARQELLGTEIWYLINLRHLKCSICCVRLDPWMRFVPIVWSLRLTVSKITKNNIVRKRLAARWNERDGLYGLIQRSKIASAETEWEDCLF